MSFIFFDKDKAEQGIINAMNSIKKDCTPEFFSNIVPYNFDCTITNMDSIELKYFSGYDIDKLFKNISKFISDTVNLDIIIDPITLTVSSEYYSETTGEISDTEICEIYIDSDETCMYFSVSVDCKNEVFTSSLLGGVNTDVVDKVSVDIGIDYITGEVFDTYIGIAKNPIEATLGTTDSVAKTTSAGSMASSTITKFEKKDDNLVSFTFDADVLDEVLDEMIAKNEASKSEATEESVGDITLDCFVNNISSKTINFISCANVEESIVTIIQLYKRFIADSVKPKASDSFGQPFDFNSSVCSEYVQSAKKILEDSAGNGKVYICVIVSEIRKQIMLQGYDTDIDDVYHVIEYKDICEKFV